MLDADQYFNIIVYKLFWYKWKIVPGNPAKILLTNVLSTRMLIVDTVLFHTDKFTNNILYSVRDIITFYNDLIYGEHGSLSIHH